MTSLKMVRSDTFVKVFTLGNGWVGSDFTGGIKFTIRDRVPEVDVVDDTGAILSVDESYMSFVGAVGTLTIPASMTNIQTGRLYWDIQGTVTGSPNYVKTIDSGTMSVSGDITRG
jgi:hypothetical protein